MIFAGNTLCLRFWIPGVAILLGGLAIRLNLGQMSCVDRLHDFMNSFGQLFCYLIGLLLIALSMKGFVIEYQSKLQHLATDKNWVERIELNKTKPVSKYVWVIWWIGVVVSLQLVNSQASD